MTYLSFLPVGIPSQSRLVFRPVYPQVIAPDPNTLNILSGGYRQRGKRRKRDEDEQLQQIEELAIQHAIEKVQASPKAQFVAAVTLEDIVGAQAYEKLGRENLKRRLTLESRIQEIQRKMRRQREDDEFMFFG